MPVALSSQFQHTVAQPLLPSLYAGITTGAIGATLGSVYATTKAHHAGIFGLAVGTQWFVLGSTFWYSRSALILATKHEQPSFRDEILYSTGAGAISGAAAGALRSRHNIIPAAFMVAMVGCVGQVGVSTLFSRLENREQSRPIMERLSDSRWWPLKSVSDEDYEKMLNEKILALEAEMALVDDKIATLRSQQTPVPSAPDKS